MTKSLLLALPLLAGAALAESSALGAEQPSQLPPAAEVLPALLDGADADGTMPLYHTPLSALLVFICDRESADAAAPRVNELVLGQNYLPSADSCEEDVLRHLRYSCNFFGSTNLLEALAPILAAESPELQQFKLTMQQLTEKQLTQERALAETLAAVCDAESEARAIAALQAFPATLKSMDAEFRISSADFRDDGDFLSAVHYADSTAPLAPLYHAYGQAQASREGGYPALREAMRGLFFSVFGDELTERLRRQVETWLTAAEKNNCEQLHAAAREWLGIASGIRDKESADAAAAWLAHKNAELGIHLRDLWGGSCPCLCNMGQSLHFAHAYLEEASPSYYGSAALKALLYVEPAPEPITPELEEPCGDEEEAYEENEENEDVTD